MFQELLVADLVLADLTLDNPTSGTSSACAMSLRARASCSCRGRGRRARSTSNTDRKLAYRLKDGAPDRSCRNDRAALTAMAKADARCLGATQG